MWSFNQTSDVKMKSPNKTMTALVRIFHRKMLIFIYQHYISADAQFDFLPIAHAKLICIFSDTSLNIFIARSLWHGWFVLLL